MPRKRDAVLVGIDVRRRRCDGDDPRLRAAAASGLYVFSYSRARLLLANSLAVMVEARSCCRRSTRPRRRRPPSATRERSPRPGRVSRAPRDAQRARARRSRCRAPRSRCAPATSSSTRPAPSTAGTSARPEEVAVAVHVRVRDERRACRSGTGWCSKPKRTAHRISTSSTGSRRSGRGTCGSPPMCTVSASAATASSSEAAAEELSKSTGRARSGSSREELDQRRRRRAPRAEQRLHAMSASSFARNGSQPAWAARRDDPVARVALAPDELARVEGGDDEHEEEKCPPAKSSTW